MTKDNCTTAYPTATAGVVQTPVSPAYRDETPRRPAAQKPAQAPAGTPAATRDRRDLCCICTYTPECMHRGTAELPKLYCELFDVDVQTLVPRDNADSSSDSGQSGEINTIGGLCCNCENRKGCTLRIPEGDVWHCEEYR